MKKILLLMLCLCMLSFTACNDKEKNANNDIISFDGYKGSPDAVMTINGEDVSVDEFNYFLIMASYDLKAANNVADDELEAFWSKTDEESGKTYSELAISDAIDRCKVFHVYRTKAIEQGITLSDSDVETIEKQANSMKDNYGEEMNRLQLKAGGLTPEVHRNITEMSHYSTLLYSDFVGDFRKITDEEMEKYYRDNYVRAKHILVLTINPETEAELSNEEKQNAFNKISEVYDKLKGGENFDKLMAEYTEDGGYQQYQDGYTFMKDDNYIEEFKEAAFALKEGEVSDIVMSSYGYHIIKREPLLDNYVNEHIEVFQEKIYQTEFQKQLDEYNNDAVIIGNKPVFEAIDVGVVLGNYLAHYDETLELIKQEFMKINGDAE